MLTQQNLKDVVEIGIALSSEKDKNRLLERLLDTAMDISGCDAGTLYLYKKSALHFRIMKTLSQGVSRGGDGQPIDLPPVALREENVCAYSAIHRELINVADVYKSDRFDFSGPRKYDSITGYRTGSMLVIPMEDAEGQLIGVLQLMNKKGSLCSAKDSESGQTGAASEAAAISDNYVSAEENFIPFTEDDAFILQALGSMTAVSLSNMIYMQEIKEQMFSFVQAFATAVDERTPYNGTHTRKVTIYADLLARGMGQKYPKEAFDDARREQLVLSAALHDIGKMIVPLEVMNKATRLDARLPFVEQRFALLEALYQRDALAKGLQAASKTPEGGEEEPSSPADLEASKEMQNATGVDPVDELREALAFIREKNTAGFLPDEDLEKISAIASRTYVGPDGTQIRWLTEEEETCMKIRKGTLTAEERQIMESHAALTAKILEKVHFNHKYSHVREFAASHHEYLNGSGYPAHLAAEDLPLETRILTVVDVFDALTCTDRPYKKPMPRERAFAILHDMAKDGQIEDRLVCLLEDVLKDVTQEQIEEMAKSDTWSAVYDGDLEGVR